MSFGLLIGIFFLILRFFQNKLIIFKKKTLISEGNKKYTLYGCGSSEDQDRCGEQFACCYSNDCLDHKNFVLKLRSNMYLSCLLIFFFAYLVFFSF